jgi:glycyl-tRNA synthetase
MEKALNFQSIILELQNFWSNQGCMIAQPYYTQVGAGTYNPCTYLRVLGPEPWNVGYVEPSIRPDDGRYGDNPNRLQQHHQFQVILKPDPGNPQEIYLQSLIAIGIDPAKHDIRFVEDNWNSPALGAWGLGWEVWLDGQEITQFTYFQQAGGIPVDPVAVEITYGLERIAMTLQNVRHFKDIDFNGSRTYGDIFFQGEREHSTYYFEAADVENVRKMYDLFEAEANNCLEQGLVFPAHDNVLKCSHTFNILDTRGAIGVTERQYFFGRMRDLARRVAEAYIEQRQEMGFPWLEPEVNQPVPQAKVDETIGKEKADFLLEIGVEELPVADLDSALEQMESEATTLFQNSNLPYREIHVEGTPRRIVLKVKDLAAHQPDQNLLVKGPPAKIAFDAEGNPTKAAIGFARGKNIPLDTLVAREIDGGVYAVAEVYQVGKSSLEVLPALLTTMMDNIKFNKSMRWNTSGKAFSRPVRWLLCLHGNVVVPCELAQLHSGNQTRGLRFSNQEKFTVEDPTAYDAFLQSQGIILNPEKRKTAIKAQVQNILSGLNADTNIDENLLDEVNNLVELPTAMLGTFDEASLALPPEVLISVMKKHQRYFAVKDKNGKLMNHFIAVRNGTEHFLNTVIDGNEQVVRARFADAAFFIKEDQEKKLEDFLPELEKLTFQVKLGSMRDKSIRITRIVEDIIATVPDAKAQEKAIIRAATLCKADLVTQMVIEMTSLQGIMGRYYALSSGESETVATAIYEHYLPNSQGEKGPSSIEGLVIGIADRLDTLTGLFAADLAPTGTKDPFALRRAAVTLVQNLIEKQIAFDLRKAISAAAEQQPVECTAETQNTVFEFVVGRLKNYLLSADFRYDVVDAVLAEQSNNPAAAYQACQELMKWIAHPEWDNILPAYSRCVRITRDLFETYPVEEALFVDDAERALFSAVNTLISAVDKDNHHVHRFFETLQPMIPTINAFFDAVLVMDEDLKIRNNRLGLLQLISNTTKGLFDLSFVEGF